MKRVLSPCIVVGVSAVLCFPGTALAGRRDCSLETLDGLYLFSASGHSLINGAWQPKAILEFIRLAGDGTLTVTAATVANRAGDGAVTQSPPGGTGSYTLNEDCKGTLQFTPGPSFDIFVGPLGGQFEMIQTNPNNVLEGTVRRVTR
jgi:hypothetical protein